jgi:hypothetical protein
MISRRARSKPGDDDIPRACEVHHASTSKSYRPEPFYHPRLVPAEIKVRGRYGLAEGARCARASERREMSSILPLIRAVLLLIFLVGYDSSSHRRPNDKPSPLACRQVNRLPGIDAMKRYDYAVFSRVERSGSVESNCPLARGARSTFCSQQLLRPASGPRLAEAGRSSSNR